MKYKEKNYSVIHFWQIHIVIKYTTGDLAKASHQDQSKKETTFEPALMKLPVLSGLPNLSLHAGLPLLLILVSRRFSYNVVLTKQVRYLHSFQIIMNMHYYIAEASLLYQVMFNKNKNLEVPLRGK